MLNHKARPNNIIDLINMLNSITDRYHRIDVWDDGTWTPEDAHNQIVWVDDNRRYARVEALSIGEIDNLNALLLQMQNLVLPSLQQQLGDLLESLDLKGLPAKFPNPKLADALEIVFRLIHTVDRMNHFVQSIAPIVMDPLHSYKKNDRDYGGLKVYRSTELISDLNDLIHPLVQTLLNHYTLFIRALPKNHQITRCDEDKLTFYSRNLVHATAETSKAIDRIIKWSKKSDFSIIQDDCRRFAIKLDPLLEDLITRIVSKTQLAKLHESIDEHELANQPQAEPANEQEDIWSHIESSDHEDNRSSTSQLTDGYDWNIPLSVDLIRLVKTARPLIKILRIFFNKLSNTPISKAPFTIGTQLCSDEITPIDHEIRSLDRGFDELLKAICEIDDNPFQLAKVKHLNILHDNICRRFDSCIALLSIHLVPLSETQYDLPQSVNLCKIWFLALREHFRLACKKLFYAIHRMEIAVDPYQLACLS
ncbi:hypothetical protein PGT21_013295 [Puccinia graminis f. sp. tritici]|uniref:Uncharacterized protein n=1 Tax=Puccinia graminis f. sp. tritici TaxID=56615 RepID=A0A5B0QIM1_PUCGR|nr:hypothetical protein PGT21_013295 [Puccinia graminis f. sp. tritici]